MISKTHTWPSRALEPPHCHGVDSAELWMGRRIRTDVPQIPKLFIPNWPHIKHFRELDKKYKAEQKCSYDNRHWVQPLPILPEKLPVWVENQAETSTWWNHAPSKCPQVLPGRRLLVKCAKTKVIFDHGLRIIQVPWVVKATHSLCLMQCT